MRAAIVVIMVAVLLLLAVLALGVRRFGPGSANEPAQAGAGNAGAVKDRPPDFDVETGSAEPGSRSAGSASPPSAVANDAGAAKPSHR